MKKLIHVIVYCFLVNSISAQSVGISTDGSAPDSSAILDLSSSNKGVLLPRISLTGSNDTSTISSVAHTMFIYNTASATDTIKSVVAPFKDSLYFTVVPGYYMWDTIADNWIRFMQQDSASETYIENIANHYSSNGLVEIRYGNEFLMIQSGNGISGKAWGGSGTVTGATSVTDGEANTSTIVTSLGAGTYAAQYCDDLTLSGYSDWYLPAKEEIAAVVNQFYLGKSLPVAQYWTSTEKTSTSAVILDLEDTGVINYANKVKTSTVPKTICFRKD